MRTHHRFEPVAVAVLAAIFFVLALLDGGPPVIGSAVVPRFAIGPLTVYISVDDFTRWFIAAVDGQEIDYATGPALGQMEAVPKMARGWQEAGELQLFQRRVGGVLHYVARRKRQALLREDVVVTDANFAGSGEGRIYAFLVGCAGRGVAVPSNAELARALGFKNAQAVRYRFNRLIELGRISVAPCGPFDVRVVTITSSGAQTAGG